MARACKVGGEPVEPHALGDGVKGVPQPPPLRLHGRVQHPAPHLRPHCRGCPSAPPPNPPGCHAWPTPPGHAATPHHQPPGPAIGCWHLQAGPPPCAQRPGGAGVCGIHPWLPAACPHLVVQAGPGGIDQHHLQPPPPSRHAGRGVGARAALDAWRWGRCCWWWTLQAAAHHPAHGRGPGPPALTGPPVPRQQVHAPWHTQAAADGGGLRRRRLLWRPGCWPTKGWRGR